MKTSMRSRPTSLTLSSLHCLFPYPYLLDTLAVPPFLTNIRLDSMSPSNPERQGLLCQLGELLLRPPLVRTSKKWLKRWTGTWHCTLPDCSCTPQLSSQLTVTCQMTSYDAFCEAIPEMYCGICLGFWCAEFAQHFRTVALDREFTLHPQYYHSNLIIQILTLKCRCNTS